MSMSPLQVWEDAARRAGMSVARDDGSVLPPMTAEERKAAQQPINDGLPSIIPIRPAHSEHKVRVTCLDGSTEELAVVIRWGTAYESDWYNQQIDRRKVELSVCEDKGQMRDLTAAIRELERDRLQLYIPDLPPNLLTRLDPQQYDVLTTALRRIELDANRIAQEAQKKMLEPYLVKESKNAN